jgi:hypothetical protein
VSIIHLPKLETRVRLTGEGGAFKETNFTRVSLFLMCGVYVKLSSLIKESFACVLKSFPTLLEAQQTFKKTTHFRRHSPICNKDLWKTTGQEDKNLETRKINFDGLVSHTKKRG